MKFAYHKRGHDHYWCDGCEDGESCPFGPCCHLEGTALRKIVDMDCVAEQKGRIMQHPRQDYIHREHESCDRIGCYPVEE